MPSVNDIRKQFLDFFDEMGLGRPKITRIPQLGQWRIDMSRANASAAGLATWGTGRVSAEDILEHAFNRTQPRVYDQIDRDKRVFNATETEAAIDKVQELQSRFEAWGRDGARGEDLAPLFNDALTIEILHALDSD